MPELIAEAPTDEDLFIWLRGHLQTILELKRQDVQRKLRSVRAAFDADIAPALLSARQRLPDGATEAPDLDQTAP
jgi:hypothetical protein